MYVRLRTALFSFCFPWRHMYIHVYKISICIPGSDLVYGMYVCSFKFHFGYSTINDLIPLFIVWYSLLCFRVSKFSCSLLVRSCNASKQNINKYIHTYTCINLNNSGIHLLLNLISITYNIIIYSMKYQKLKQIFNSYILLNAFYLYQLFLVFYWQI